MDAPPGINMASAYPGASAYHPGADALGNQLDHQLGSPYRDPFNGNQPQQPYNQTQVPPSVPGVGVNIAASERFNFKSSYGRLELRNILREDVDRIRSTVLAVQHSC